MVVTEELTGSELEELRVALASLETDLREQIDSSREAVRPVALDQTAVGRVSRVDALQGQAMAQANREAAQIRLRQCHAALEALERGDYGFCRQCEEPIGVKRLRARPEAPRCLGCQGGAERR